MRIPRSLQLFSTRGFIHQFWRCHNKEFYLLKSSIKALYLQCVQRALKSHNKDGSLQIFAYTVMDNHFHSLMNYRDGSSKFSRFLRQAHGLFGAKFNKLNKRSGKVAEGRPKTSLIENIEHLMRVHFYIEANPVRAGKCSVNLLRCYKFSSYRYYAYGIKDEFTSILTVPEWYRKLGRTARLRQSRYRTLFLDYLRKPTEKVEMFSAFIGSTLWRLSALKLLSEALSERKFRSKEPNENSS